MIVCVPQFLANRELVSVLEEGLSVALSSYMLSLVGTWHWKYEDPAAVNTSYFQDIDKT